MDSAIFQQRSGHPLAGRQTGIPQASSGPCSLQGLGWWLDLQGSAVMSRGGNIGVLAPVPTQAHVAFAVATFLPFRAHVHSTSCWLVPGHHHLMAGADCSSVLAGQAEAAALLKNPPADPDAAQRLDLRHQHVVTIDDPDTRGGGRPSLLLA